MLLQNGAKHILDFLDLEDCELAFFVSVGLRVKKASNDLLLCDILGHTNLDDVFGIAVDVGDDKRM